MRLRPWPFNGRKEGRITNAVWVGEGQVRRQDYRMYTMLSDVRGKFFPTELVGKPFHTGDIFLSSEPATFIQHFMKPASTLLVV